MNWTRLKHPAVWGHFLVALFFAPCIYVGWWLKGYNSLWLTLMVLSALNVVGFSFITWREYRGKGLYFKRGE